jgi:hypothetical protein
MHRTTLLLAIACLAPAARAETEPESLYDLKAEATPKLAKGAKGVVSVQVAPRRGAHVKAETPFDAHLVAPAIVTLAKADVARADVTYNSDGARFAVPFTAVGTGSSSIEMSLVFVVCTDQSCFRVKKTALLPVTVR